MPYTESESMALKRISVALKKNDKELLSFGITKTDQMLKSGLPFELDLEWLGLIKMTRNTDIPENLINRLKDLIDNIVINNNNDQGNIMSTTQENQLLTNANTVEQYEYTIVIDSQIKAEDINTILKLQVNHINTVLKEQHTCNLDILTDLSTLINSANNNIVELEGIECFLSSIKKNYCIILTGYNISIIELIKKYKINFRIPEVIKSSNQTTCAIYPLYGSIAIHKCSNCGKRIFIRYPQQTIVSICSDCSYPAFPDLYPSNIEFYQSNPQIWYKAYNALVKSKNLILVLPTKMSLKRSAHKLLIEALPHAQAQNTYTICNNIQSGEFWANQFEHLDIKTKLHPVYFNIELLINNEFNISNND